MAYTTPGTVAAGDVYTAAAHNIQVNNVIALAVPSTCIMTFSGYTHNNLAGVLNPTFTEEVDNDSMHATGANNSRITINTAGVYLICITIQQTAGASTQQYIEVYKNGVSIGWQGSAQASGSTTGSVSVVSKAIATDYYQMFVNNGGTSTLTGRFSVNLVGVNVS